MDAALAAPTATVRRTRALAVAATLALIALGLAWELWLAPTGRGTLAVKVLPLFLPLPGLLRLRLYTYRWLSLGVWLYVAEGAVRAGSDRGLSAALALIEVAIALVLFTTCCIHIRARLRAGAALAVAAQAQP
jgi:uncharacterized membrane protein